jgi:hypothetical protein
MDFIIGAPFSDNGGIENGAVYIYDSDGTTIPTSATDLENGTSLGERLGASLGGGKYGSDTMYQLAAGAPYWDDLSPFWFDAGRVWVMSIPEFSDVVVAITGVGIVMLPVLALSKKRRRNEKD